MSRELSLEQRDRLVALLLDELRRAWVAARAAGGDPAALDRIMAERRRRLRSLVGDDGQYGVDDARNGPGLGE